MKRISKVASYFGMLLIRLSCKANIGRLQVVSPIRRNPPRGSKKISEKKKKKTDVSTPRRTLGVRPTKSAVFRCASLSEFRAGLFLLLFTGRTIFDSCDGSRPKQEQLTVYTLQIATTISCIRFHPFRTSCAELYMSFFLSHELYVHSCQFMRLRGKR